MLGLRLNHVSEKGYRGSAVVTKYYYVREYDSMDIFKVHHYVIKDSPLK